MGLQLCLPAPPSKSVGFWACTRVLNDSIDAVSTTTNNRQRQEEEYGVAKIARATASNKGESSAGYAARINVSSYHRCRSSAKGCSYLVEPTSQLGPTVRKPARALAQATAR